MNWHTDELKTKHEKSILKSLAELQLYCNALIMKTIAHQFEVLRRTVISLSCSGATGAFFCFPTPCQDLAVLLGVVWLKDPNPVGKF